MRTTVKGQLADYFQYVDEEQGRVDVDEIIEPSPPVVQLAPYRPRTWRRAALAAVASAVGAFVIIGLVLLADPFSGSDTVPLPPASPAPVEPTAAPVVDEPPVVAPESSPTIGGSAAEPQQEPVADEPALRAQTVTWSRLDDVTGALGGEGDQFLQAAVVGGPGYIVVGAECPGHCPMLTPDGRPSVGPGLDDWAAAVWVSADGTAWERVTHDEALFGGAGDQVMMSVAAGGPGYVAVGWTDYGFFTGGMTDRFGDYPEDVGLLDAEVWVSADGVAWERVPDPAGAFTGPGNQRMEAVVAGGPGLVAVGFESRDPVGMNLGAQAAIWTSRDGYTWERASLDGASVGPLGTMLHAAAVGESGLVAVGRDISMYVGAPIPENPGPAEFFAVPTEPGDPAKQRSYESAAVWVSSDGVSWERVSPYDPVFGGMPESHPDAYSIDGGPIRMLSIWLSTDGYTWSRVDDGDPVWGEWRGEGRDLAVDGGRVVSVGVLSEDNDFWDDETRRFAPISRGTFYVEMSDVLIKGDRLLAVGSAGSASSDFDGAIWLGEWDG
jgi:hypothetical protein